jgi:hypothetical protein
MSNLTCAGCGSVYPWAGVRNRDVFPCAVCSRAIVVPIAGPSEARAAAATRPATTAERAPDEPPPVPAAPPAPAPAARPAPRPAAPAPRVRHEEESEPLEAHRMKSLVGLSHGVVGLFAVSILVELASIYGDWKAIEFLREADVRAVDMERAAQIDAANVKIAIVLVAVVLALFTAFIIWFHRAHANVRDAKATTLRYGSGWAIGGFFVPFLNFVRPAQVMNDVWSGTAELPGEPRAARRRRRTTSPLAAWWWGMHMFGGVLGYAGANLVQPDQLLAGSWLSIVASVAAIVSAAAGIELVRSVTRLQEWARTRER